MNELLIEYGHIPAIIIAVFFGVFWLSIPFYLGECAKTRMLMDMIQRGETVFFSDLNRNINNFAGLEFAFGYHPSEKLFPHLYKNTVFKKHIGDLKKLQKFYLRAIITIAILIVLLFVGRVYVVKVQKEKGLITMQSKLSTPPTNYSL